MSAKALAFSREMDSWPYRLGNILDVYTVTRFLISEQLKLGHQCSDSSSFKNKMPCSHFFVGNMSNALFTRGREVTSLGFASISLGGGGGEGGCDCEIIDLFPVI